MGKISVRIVLFQVTNYCNMLRITDSSLAYNRCFGCSIFWLWDAAMHRNMNTTWRCLPLYWKPQCQDLNQFRSKEILLSHCSASLYEQVFNSWSNIACPEPPAAVGFRHFWGSPQNRWPSRDVPEWRAHVCVSWIFRLFRFVFPQWVTFPHVPWKIDQHLPQKSSSHVGEYTCKM